MGMLISITFAASQAVITMPITFVRILHKYSAVNVGSQNYTFGYVAKSLTGLWRCRIVRVNFKCAWFTMCSTYIFVVQKPTVTPKNRHCIKQVALSVYQKTVTPHFQSFTERNGSFFILTLSV